MNRKPNVICCVCQTPVYRRKTESGLYYCSRKCYGIDCRKPHNCPVCGKEILSGQNAKTYSKACSNKQRTGIKYDGQRNLSKAKQNQTLKNILVSNFGPRCQLCSYDNLNVLQVHHIVKRSKGGTNELSNLQLLCPNCHCTIHLGDSRMEDKPR
jgi:RNA-directed DNA polymerase